MSDQDEVRAVLALAEYHENLCAKYRNGECHTRRCLLRGGWNQAAPVDYSVSTCEEHETAIALRRAAAPTASVQALRTIADKLSERETVTDLEASWRKLNGLLVEVRQLAEAALSAAPVERAAAIRNRGGDHASAPVLHDGKSPL